MIWQLCSFHVTLTILKSPVLHLWLAYFSSSITSLFQITVHFGPQLLWKSPKIVSISFCPCPKMESEGLVNKHLLFGSFKLVRWFLLLCNEAGILFLFPYQTCWLSLGPSCYSRVPAPDNVAKHYKITTTFNISLCYFVATLEIE